MLCNWELRDLAAHLQREKLFVLSEQQNLQILNERLKYMSTCLGQLAWITSYQRINLNHLILAKVDCLPALSCQRNYTIDNVVFVDAYRVLGYQEALAYGEFLTVLRESCEMVAGCLSAGDKMFPEAMPDIVHSLSSGLFGSCLLPEDKIIVMKLLRHLALLQLVPSENPRRLLRHGSCAFARFYSVFHENLYSAKLFLTAALHGPIMKLLMEDEMFLDIDPDKAVLRFPAKERLLKFGPDGTPEQAAKLQRYREWTIKRLVSLSEEFIFSLRDNMHCFPISVCWLVRQMAGLFTKSGFLGEKEIYEICIDLVFTNFICPAIVNPEPYGITDALIGHVARFNLMQVAQILQMLAMRKYEGVDPKVADLYCHFETDCVSSILERILEDSAETLDDQPTAGETTMVEGLSRSAALFTHSQLNNLVKFLQNLLSTEDFTLDKTQLESMLSRLPTVLTNGHKPSSSKAQNEKHNNHLESSLLKKPAALLSKVSKQRSHSLNSVSNFGIVGDNGDETRSEEDIPEQVLVIPLAGREEDALGLLPEQKVLELEGKRQVSVIPIGVPGSEELANVSVGRHSGESQEKRTRFSLSHDEGSIGNTSDNLEAVSEAASNHSGASSLESENEDQNDNLSDMISANVSGRGTPNISGRDTPSSQITEGDEGRIGIGEQSRGSVSEHRPALPRVSKQSRSDIDDKFGKFEIKKQEVLGDETISLVSDTWSTDVLASDSETIEQSDRNFPRPPDDGPPHPFIQHSLDISETVSEAWSTDVLTSDSERLTEVDTDDTASVARSDDTAHSECGLRGDTEGGETPPPHSCAFFRPIRVVVPSNRISLAVPPSPTRADLWTVGTRGTCKYDYRRRTLEFVDSGFPRGFNKTCSNNTESARMIHVIEKIDVAKSNPLPSPSSKSSRNGSIARSPSPQSHSQPIPNGIVHPLPESNIVPNDHAQKLDLENCNMPVVAHENNSVLTSDKASDVNEEGAGLFDDSDITPPSPLLSNTYSPPSLLPTTSIYLNNHKGQTPSFMLPNKFGEMKLKQEAEDSERVFLSSTSLASTSSSGSNSGTASQPPSAVRNVEKLNMVTGAIPKSISFDKTAERGDKEFMDEEQKHKKGFFRNLKMSFKNRKMKHFKGEDLIRFDESISGGGGDGFNGSRLRRGASEDSRMQNGGTPGVEDILAKYRGKAQAETGELNSNELIEKKLIETEEEERLSEESIFINAKQKLRKVFGSSDLQFCSSVSARDDELVSFLKLQLAEAINVQNRSLVSQLHETLRCISLFDYDGCRTLFKALKDDYQSRAPYIAYLIRSRQTLLSSLAYFERMTERLESESKVCRKFLVALCVRIFLERREDLCRSFSAEFQQLTMADEKTDLLDRFLKELTHQLEKDPTWQGASNSQLDQAKSIIETAIMSRVYPYALYPNGDGDVSRDQVLHEHMKKLAAVITPNHKDLRIPKRFHLECPWSSAQAEISGLGAYKTPRDKVACVSRCATTIMHLLSMTTEGGEPSADDFVPVLVYVLIAANPPALLSTIQYVESFYGSRLEGEDQYWWTQFSSAIEFIKTMDYSS